MNIADPDLFEWIEKRRVGISMYFQYNHLVERQTKSCKLKKKLRVLIMFCCYIIICMNSVHDVFEISL